MEKGRYYEEEISGFGYAYLFGACLLVYTIASLCKYDSFGGNNGGNFYYSTVKILTQKYRRGGIGMVTFFENAAAWIGEKMAMLSLQQCCTLLSYEPEMPEELFEEV